MGKSENEVLSDAYDLLNVPPAVQRLLDKHKDALKKLRSECVDLREKLMRAQNPEFAWVVFEDSKIIAVCSSEQNAKWLAGRPDTARHAAEIPMNVEDPTDE